MEKKIFRKLSCIALALAIAFSGSFFMPGDLQATQGSIAYATSVSDLTVKAKDYESISLSWDSVSNAKSYQVYRSTSRKGTYKKVASTRDLSYFDKKVEQNKTYYYKVKVLKKNGTSKFTSTKSGKINTVVSLSDIPSYSYEPYTEVNANIPSFSKRMIRASAYEKYAKLDSKGRCGAAISCISTELMPTEERGSIGMIKPSGWHTVRYDDLVDGKYLYNRCHLLGFQLTGENANERNLITGTRYLNVTGMLPFENEVANYIRETNNHVLYRVTPVFKENDLVCRGVQMEAYSIEDNGEGVSFNVYCYNVQPGVRIRYSDGESCREGESFPEKIKDTTSKVTTVKNNTSGSVTYVLNTNTKKFHKVYCSSVETIKPKNREDSTASRSQIISMGYDPCKRCNP